MVAVILLRMGATKNSHLIGGTVQSTAHLSIPDYEAIKSRQRENWAAGDFGRIGVQLQIVGELLCEAVDLRSSDRVLDVAAGNGNASLAAARRFANVTSTDYVAELLEQGSRRADADGLAMTFRTADAENLPFADAAFDVVLSTFGVMFAPNQKRAAAELLRVVKPGGRIGLANWTPDGFVGELFHVIGRVAPPPAGLASPAAWGTETRLVELFGPHARDLRTQRRPHVFLIAPPPTGSTCSSATTGRSTRRSPRWTSPASRRSARRCSSCWGDSIAAARRR